MVGPRRQGACDAAPEPAARTPERQALAQAIVNRDHVAGLVEARRAIVEGFYAQTAPLNQEELRLQEELRQVPAAERNRLMVLLGGVQPTETRDEAAIKKALAEIDAQYAELKAEQERAEADVALLEGDLRYREAEVRDCIRDVVMTDPATASVQAELETIVARRALLGRAATHSLNERRPGQPTPRISILAQLVADPPRTPCPWAAAKARLTTDPDAVLPMPADVA